MSGQAWADLIEGLTLLSEHSNNDTSPLHCEHDELTIMADPQEFTQLELDRLQDLGFIPNDTDEVFVSFRFGSA